MLNSFIIRPASLLDLDDLAEMAYDAQSGLTSLPRDKVLLRDKIFLSQQMLCFPTSKVLGQDSLYLFVMEDLNTNEVVGTCSIVVKMNQNIPQIFYRETTVN